MNNQEPIIAAILGELEILPGFNIGGHNNLRYADNTVLTADIEKK